MNVFFNSLKLESLINNPCADRSYACTIWLSEACVVQKIKGTLLNFFLFNGKTGKQIF